MCPLADVRVVAEFVEYPAQSQCDKGLIFQLRREQKLCSEAFIKDNPCITGTTS